MLLLYVHRDDFGTKIARWKAMVRVPCFDIGSFSLQTITQQKNLTEVVLRLVCFQFSKVRKSTAVIPCKF